MKLFALNKNEWIRCCASCERVFHKWNQHKYPGGCPSCGFAHYGARFVYGEWSYLYIIYRMIKDYFIKYKK